MSTCPPGAGWPVRLSPSPPRAPAEIWHVGRRGACCSLEKRFLCSRVDNGSSCKKKKPTQTPKHNNNNNKRTSKKQISTLLCISIAEGCAQYPCCCSQPCGTPLRGTGWDQRHGPVWGKPEEGRRRDGRLGSTAQGEPPEHPVCLGCGR